MLNKWLSSFAWYRSLGKMNESWLPMFVIYNTGSHLFLAQVKDPYSPIPWSQQWVWLEYRRYNPVWVRNPKLRRFEGCGIANHGHIGTSYFHRRAFVGIDYDEEYRFTIPPRYMLHMVETMGGPEFHLEFHPLSSVRLASQCKR